jgi:hypothetical protein
MMLSCNHVDLELAPRLERQRCDEQVASRSSLANIGEEVAEEFLIFDA